MSKPRTGRVYGVEHVGMTVPNIEEATRFLIDAFDAEVIMTMLDENSEPPPWNPEAAEVEGALGAAPGATIAGLRMLRLGNSANLELFRYSGSEQRPAHRPSDLGIQHFCLQVDDIRAVRERVLAAGGEALDGPNEMVAGEEGAGNHFIYVRTPWGSTIELIEVPSPMAYEADTRQRRWRPA